LQVVGALMGLDGGLLVLAGYTKVRRPHVLVLTYGEGLPLTRGTARLIGLIEASLGVAALAISTSLVRIGLAFLFASFSAITAWRLVRDPRKRGCGCFGIENTPVTPLHLTTNVIGAVVAVLAVRWNAPSPLRLAVLQPTAAAALSIGLTASVYGMYLLLSELPRYQQATTRTHAREVEVSMS
jgi:hypothetical protein